MIPALVALSLSLAGGVAGLAGVVLDPHDLPAPHARVALACGTQHASVQTDAQGRFAIALDMRGDCTLTVERAGFAPFRTAVRADAADPIVVRLALEPVAQHVAVTAAAPPRPSFLSVTLAEDDFRALAGTTADLIRHAQLLAGASALRTAVYVDGLPGATLPPLDQIARISVNGDPFSAEYADGDVATIQLITRAPARTFRVRTGSDAIGFGGRNLLSGRGSDASASANAAVSGPLPALPITFMLTANAGHASSLVPVLATVPGSAPPAADVRMRQGHRAIALDLHAAWSDSRVRATIRDARGSSVNAGAGGLALEETGFATTSGTRELRATVNHLVGGLTYDGGGLLTASHYGSRANATTPGVSIVGAVQMGGAAIARADTDRLSWMTKHVVRSAAARPWSAGVVIARSAHASTERPNPWGHLQFESADAYAAARDGAPLGLLFGARGDTRVRHAATTVSPFAQTVLWRSADVEVNAGLRADYQSGFGVIVSPRVAVGARIAGFRVAAGSGLFARQVPDAIVIRSMALDGRQTQRFIASGVSLAGLSSVSGIPQPVVRMRLDAGMRQPVQVMQRLSVERAFGRVVPALEYTWSRQQHGLGAERRADDAGWVDVIASNRSAVRHRLHAQVRYGWRRHHLFAHYEWVRARDNGDGPLAFPQEPGNLDAEWARTAGVAAHQATVMASFALGGLSVNVTDTWSSSTPYNVTTGRDPSGSRLYVDRGGRPRNSGDLPGMHDLSLYAFRRFALPDVVVPGAIRLHLNAGVQARNLLDNRNYIHIGSVAASPAFGRPLAAWPGRSVRLFLTID
jgi:hypothetical protein